MYFSLYVILIIFIQTSATKNSNKKFILYGFRRQFFSQKNEHYNNKIQYKCLHTHNYKL